MDEADHKPSEGISRAETDTWRSWVLCLSASFTTAVCYGFFLGCTSLYFVALLHEFGESRGKTGEPAMSCNPRNHPRKSHSTSVCEETQTRELTVDYCYRIQTVRWAWMSLSQNSSSSSGFIMAGHTQHVHYQSRSKYRCVASSLINSLKIKKSHLIWTLHHFETTGANQREFNLFSPLALHSFLYPHVLRCINYTR